MWSCAGSSNSESPQLALLLLAKSVPGDAEQCGIADETQCGGDTPPRHECVGAVVPSVAGVPAAVPAVAPAVVPAVVPGAVPPAVPATRLPERFELASASTVVGCAPQYYSDANLFIGTSALLKLKRIHGVGLHCNRDYADDEIVCEYVGDGLTLEQAKLTDSTYHFNVRDERGNVVHVIDGSDPARASVGRYVNAARYLEEQNCKFVQVGLRIFLVTIRAVAAGHELLGWYGRGTNGMCTKRRPRARDI